MIQPEYSIYLKTSAGLRGAYLNDITSVDITFRWNTVTKWTLTGSGLSACPLGKGAEIIIYRGESPFLSGYVTSIEDSYNAVTGIYDWVVEGEDDLGKLARRVVYPDPADADVQVPGTVYSETGNLTDLLLEAISANICYDAELTARRIVTLAAQVSDHAGDEVTITSEYDNLWTFVKKQIEDRTFGIRSVWNGATGVSTIEFYTPHDVSSTVVFSVEAGSLSGWSRKRTAPKGNVILVTGVEITDEDDNGTGEYQTVMVQDADSISQWGRRELRIKHSDIKPIIEKDDEGEIIYTEPWESVQEKLEQAALNDLIDNAAKDSYELQIVELDRMQYKVHWDLGDIVSVRVGDTEMTAPIMEIKISYQSGIETISPAIGELQRGELESIFNDLGALKENVKILQSGM